MKYLLDLDTNEKSLKRIQELFRHLRDILIIQHKDSIESVEGGASPYYKVNIDIKEEWV